MSAAPGFQIESDAPHMSRIEPTIRERIHVYDFIRGVAILGILLANIPWFAAPGFADAMGMGVPATGLDAQVERWTLVFATGKFRSMLAILFGVGIWLQYEKRRAIPGNWPGGYLKRTLILCAVGVIHGVFIWHGDILLMYSGVALIVCLLMGFSDRVLKWIVGGSAALALLLGFGAFGLSFTDIMAGSNATEADLMGITPAREITAFAHGSYLDQLAVRAPMFALMATSLVVMAPLLGGLFTLGALFAKHGALASPRSHPKVRNAMLALGFGLGLPLCALAASLHDGERAFLLETATELCFGPMMAMGLMMLLAIIAERGLASPLQGAIAKVGRTAFTNYLLQSILCTAIFYSWGGGWYGTLSRAAMLGVVGVVWTANLLFAHFWLRGFSMGPIEWLWRSLTEGRRLPLRHEAAMP